MKNRYILSYNGENKISEDDLEIFKTKKIEILDSSARSLLVSGNVNEIKKTIRNLNGWTYEKEQFFPLPNLRKTIKKNNI